MKNYINYKLNSLGINPNIMKNYDEPHRFYHNREHISNMLKGAIENDKIDTSLFLAIVFHDIIYNPRKDNNEELSALFFRETYNGDFKDEISQSILDTKKHKPTNEISKKLCELDLSILNSDLLGLISYEHKIFKEYQFVDWSIYKPKRIEVLKSLQKSDELEVLINYVKNRKPNIAVMYLESDNINHENKILEAEKLFDKVVFMTDKISMTEINPKYNYKQLLSLTDKDYKDANHKLQYPVTLIK